MCNINHNILKQIPVASCQVLLELFGVDVAFIVLLMYLGYTEACPQVSKQFMPEVRHFQNPNAVPWP